jgi:hypothetical protein
VTLSINDTQPNQRLAVSNALQYAECCYAESHALFVVMLNVIMLNIVATFVADLKHAKVRNKITNAFNGKFHSVKLWLSLETVREFP